VQRVLELALPFYRSALGRDVNVSLALLGPAEWRAWNTQYTAPGGAPFSSMLPGVERLPDGTRVMLLPAESGHRLSDQVRRLWAESPELRELGPSPDSVADRFATLIGFHELGHVYTAADSVRPSEAWFNELLATYLAYAFLRARAPDDARLWERVSAALVKGLQPTQTSLARMFGGGADTYVWYQASLQIRVRELYDAQGLDFYRRVKEQRAAIGDRSKEVPLIEVLEQIAPGFLAWQRRYHPVDSLPEKK
jgi:hypothetical protein